MNELGRMVSVLRRSFMSRTPLQPPYEELTRLEFLCSKVLIRTVMKHGYARKLARTPIRVYENNEKPPTNNTSRSTIKDSSFEPGPREQTSVSVFK